MKVKKIWEESDHNAFTDLVLFRNRLFCVFREGEAHVSLNGTVRVMTSPDGEVWETASTLELGGQDLRDPHLCVTPDSRLMLVASGHDRLHETPFLTYAWFSEDGCHWPSITPIGQKGYWLWQVHWAGNTALSLGGCGDHVRLYTSDDGIHFSAVAPWLVKGNFPNEFDMESDATGKVTCLLRRDKGSCSALLGTSLPPYSRWEWIDMGVRVGGPHLRRLPNGRLLGIVRLYDRRIRTSICLIDEHDATLEETVELPSGGDCSYAGSALWNDTLFVSYYSEHEGKCAIYMAQLPWKELIS